MFCFRRSDAFPQAASCFSPGATGVAASGVATGAAAGTTGEATGAATGEATTPTMGVVAAPQPHPPLPQQVPPTTSTFALQQLFVP